MSDILDTNQPIDESTATYKDNVLRYGVIGGLISIALSVVTFMTTTPGETNYLMSILSLAITIGIAVMAIKTHRDDDLGGYISFGRAFSVGFLALLVAAVLNTIFTYIYMTVIDSSFQQQILDATAAQYEANGMTEEQIEQALSMAGMFITPIGISLMALVGGAIFGAIVSAIVAAIMKKKPAFA